MRHESGKEVFSGKHDTVVDDKWQLYLPKKFAEGFNGRLSLAIIALTEGGCVRIYPFPEESAPISAEVRLRRGRERKYAKITIPDIFRESMSFHYGRTITIVGMGDYIELWPRPPWNDEKKERKVRYWEPPLLRFP